ncbi:MAG: SRPBCC family protein [Nannocystales bacterium]
MQNVTVTRIVHAEIKTVWDLVADVTRVVNWHPSVHRVDLLSENATGLGAARRCNFYDGTSVRETVTELDEGSRLKVVLSEYSLPMKTFEAEIRLQAMADGNTQVTFSMNYEMKFGIFGKAMNALMVRGQMTKLMSSVLSGLDQHGATGEIIGEDFVPKAA